MPLLVALDRLPSVAVLSAFNVLIPALTKGATLGIQVLLVEEDTVPASATLWNVVACSGTIVIRQLSGFSHCFESV